MYYQLSSIGEEIGVQMFWLRLFHPQWALVAPEKIRDGYGRKLRAWRIDWQGQLELFESLYSTPLPGMKYKNLSHWKNVLRKILAIAGDEYIKYERLEFMVDAPMALRLYRAGAIRLDQLMSGATVGDATSLMLPTDFRMSKSLTPETEYLRLRWDLLGQPVTLLIAAGRFSPGGNYVHFRVAEKDCSTIYAVWTTTNLDYIRPFRRPLMVFGSTGGIDDDEEE